MFLPARSRKLLRIVAMLVAGGLLAACGYKGPLYLPKPAAGNPSAATPAPRPAGMPPESTDPSTTSPVETIPVPADLDSTSR